MAADITSQNIVGYYGLANEGDSAKGVGALFMPVNGDTEYLLSSVTVSGDDFMRPGMEYIQELDPADTSVCGRYFYISQATLEDEFEEDWEDYKGAIGWWNHELGRKGPQYFAAIEEGNYEWKVSASKTFPVGQAFLGMFNKRDFTFTSSGEAPVETTQLDNEGNSAYYFLNYIPRTLDINEIEVTGDDFMRPGMEYIQVLDPTDTSVSARYFYISQATLEDEFEEDWEDYKGAIGWWRHELGRKGPQYFAAIEEGNYEWKMTTLDVNPGDSFLGMFNKRSFVFNFPKSTEAAK